MNAIRLAGPDDDPDALLALQHRLDEQSTYMLLEPGEHGSATPSGYGAANSDW